METAYRPEIKSEKITYGTEDYGTKVEKPTTVWISQRRPLHSVRIRAVHRPECKRKDNPLYEVERSPTLRSSRKNVKYNVGKRHPRKRKVTTWGKAIPEKGDPQQTSVCKN